MQSTGLRGSLRPSPKATATACVIAIVLFLALFTTSCTSSPSQDTVRLAIRINQYTTDDITAVELNRRLERESDDLGISISKLEQAYLILIPAIQDYSESQEIVKAAVEARRATGLDFVEIVKEMRDVYIHGVIVTDDGRVIPVKPPDESE